LCNKYRPETSAAKKERVKEADAAAVSGGKAPDRETRQIKYGLKHVTTLIEEKKAELVLIACNVNPIELVMWMPALYNSSVTLTLLCPLPIRDLNILQYEVASLPPYEAALIDGPLARYSRDGVLILRLRQQPLLSPNLVTNH